MVVVFVVVVVESGHSGTPLIVCSGGVAGSWKWGGVLLRVRHRGAALLVSIGTRL